MIKKIGRRIFYDTNNGDSIFQIGEKYGFFSIVSIEEEIKNYPILSERTRESFDYIELEYGQYAQDFRECNGYRVNPETKELEFSYPDPNEEEPQEPVYQPPLSMEVDELKKENTLLKAQNQANSDRADFHEEVLTEIILAINP